MYKVRDCQHHNLLGNISIILHNFKQEANSLFAILNVTSGKVYFPARSCGVKCGTFNLKCSTAFKKKEKRNLFIYFFYDYYFNSDILLGYLNTNGHFRTWSRECGAQEDLSKFQACRNMERKIKRWSVLVRKSEKSGGKSKSKNVLLSKDLHNYVFHDD